MPSASIQLLLTGRYPRQLGPIVLASLFLVVGWRAEAQTITTAAGIGTSGFGGDGGPGTAAALNQPGSVAVDAAGNVYINDNVNNRIRRIDAVTGIITTYAGNGIVVFDTRDGAALGDGGPATSASLRNPRGVAVDGAGNLYIADMSNHRVRRVDAVTGIITTVAGNGNGPSPLGTGDGDGGLATAVIVSDPHGVDLDAAGNLFIAVNFRIRRVDAATGIITTVAGGGTGPFTDPAGIGDEGPATAAALFGGGSSGVAVDAAGNIFIADTFNSRIRKVDASGIITTVAGPESVFDPRGVGVDATGNVFIADSGANVIRRIDAATGTIAVVAGTGFPGFAGDGGLATCALLNTPDGVASDAAGNLFIADRANNRVRRVGAEGLPGAGPDQTVDEGALVQLDGCRMQLNVCGGGANRTYSWMQVAGAPNVMLSAADACASTFIAPSVAADGAVLTLQLTLTDGPNLRSDTVDVTVKNVNHPPGTDAGNDQQVAEETLVMLDGSNSFDPDGDPLTYAWTQTGGTSVILSDLTAATPTFEAPLLASGTEVFTFQLTGSDGIASTTDEVQITVENVNHPPKADAGPDASKTTGVLVTLDGSLSSDPDGATGLLYFWTKIDGPAVTISGPDEAFATFIPFEPGTYVFKLEVTDPGGLTSQDEVAIVVLALNDPPACGVARPTLPYLWPPNHKMVSVGIAGVSDADGDAVSITIVGVAQDEPVNDLGDGDTSPDAVLQQSTVLLRSERSGTRNGRYYHVGFRAEDGRGAACVGTVQVFVPHDMKKPITAVDEGPMFDSTRR